LLQLRGEGPRASTGGLFGTFEGQRQPDHQRVGEPFLLQRVEPGPVWLALAHDDDGQGTGAAGEGIADRHAGDTAADVETEDAAHACPA
jgi:hypothetical protein